MLFLKTNTVGAIKIMADNKVENNNVIRNNSDQMIMISDKEDILTIPTVDFVENYKKGLFIEGTITNVISDITQHNKQSEKMQQQQYELIHHQKKRQKRFPAEKSEQTDWFRWPGPCKNDNNCPPNLYCVNGSCWHLSNKPIRMHQIHLQRAMATTTTTTTITETATATTTSITTATTTTIRTTAFDQPKSSTFITTKSKTTNSNHQKIRQQQITTTDNRIQTSKLPVYTKYIQQRQFGKPIRIELYLAKAVLRDECSQDSHCGHWMICCHKRWYDLSADSGTGYFCLPNCKLTKKINLEIHEANGLIPNDIIYD
ncbi:hypothetical protein ACH3XW_29590 [Acanthocheilonema viteae]